MRAIESVWLEPADVRASRDALAAIAEADLVVVGPGSLYTSILPPAAGAGDPGRPRDHAGAARLRLQRCHPGRRDGGVRPGRPRGGPGGAPRAGRGRHRAREQPPRRAACRTWSSACPVKLRWPPVGAARRPRLVLDDVVDPANPHHHDPELLAASAASHRPARGRAGTATRGCAIRLTRRGRAPIATSLRLCAPSWPPLSPRAPATGRPRLPGSASAASGVIGRPLPASWSACSARTTPHGIRAATARTFDWDRAADHCRAAYLRGRFLVRGSLSVTAGRYHLEFVVPVDEAPVLAARLAAAGPPGGRPRAARPRGRDMEGRRDDRHLPALDRGRAHRSSSSNPARSRAPCGAT